MKLIPSVKISLLFYLNGNDSLWTNPFASSGITGEETEIDKTLTIINVNHILYSRCHCRGCWYRKRKSPWRIRREYPGGGIDRIFIFSMYVRYRRKKFLLY